MLRFKILKIPNTKDFQKQILTKWFRLFKICLAKYFSTIKRLQ